MNHASPRMPWKAGFNPSTTIDDIYYCFRLLLGRNPGEREWSSHVWRAGEDLTGVVRSYLSSREFSQRKMLAHEAPVDIELIKLNGFSIYTSASDVAVGKHVRANAYEPDVTAIFRRFLRPGMAVIDVGANIGYFTMLSASLVGPKGYVLAVEPNPNNVRMLEGSRRVNGFDQVELAYAAAWSKKGLLALNASYSNGVTSAIETGIGALMAVQIVPSFTLSALAPQDRPVDFVKIDIEGAEYSALMGARDILARNHPIIVSEFSPVQLQAVSGVSGEEYLCFLTDLGYRLAVIEREGNLSEHGADIATVMDAYQNCGTDHIDILATAG